MDFFFPLVLFLNRLCLSLSFLFRGVQIWDSVNALLPSLYSGCPKSNKKLTILQQSMEILLQLGFYEICAQIDDLNINISKKFPLIVLTVQSYDAQKHKNTQ